MQNRRNKVKVQIQQVVVVGASAGGINAIIQVLSCLPPDLPAAILIVQHLSSNYQSRLNEHLGRYSPLRVNMAKDRMPLEEGVVYIAVPGQHLRLGNECLFLGADEAVQYVRPAADMLFASAAAAFGPKVIGVILSGTGRDGARGCQEIKAKGGVTIAQDEKTSRYFGMPKAAIDANAIDYVLPLSEIAGKVVALVRKTIDYRKEIKDE